VHNGPSLIARRTNACAAGQARRAIGVLMAAVVLLVTLQLVGPAAARASTTLSASVTPVSTSALQVQWTPPAGFTPRAWTVLVVDTQGRSWGARSACIDCRSTLVDGLAAGVRYRVSVIAWGTTGTVAKTLEATVPAGACAGVTGTCVSVGAGTRAAAAHVAQGFLFGVTERTDPAQVKGLSPRSWRIAPHTPASFARARAAGGDITLILSDSWPAYAAQNGLAGANPWESWPAYTSFVMSTVKRHVALGMLPEYWEVQNEPDGNGIYKAGSAATHSLVLEQFEVAHDAIRSLLPQARIVGPSLSMFRYRDPRAVIDLESFVDHAAANGLRFDLAWHENGNDALGRFDGDPKSLIGHVEMVRQLVADRPSLRDARVLINEYAAPWSFDQPGAAVGYMAALETAGVDGASRSCFPIRVGGTVHDTCFSQPGLLDGLLLPDGAKADTFAVHDAYASMAGARLQTSTTDMWTSALSAIDGRTVRTLIGRHQSCTAKLNSGCPTGWKTAPAGAPVTLKLPCTGAEAHRVRVERIVDAAAVATAPTTVLSATLRCSGGAVTVKLAGLPDGAVYSAVSTR